MREQISEGLSEAANNLCGFTPSGLARTAQFTDAVLALVRQALQSQAARLQWFAPASLKAAISVDWYSVYRITAAL